MKKTIYDCSINEYVEVDMTAQEVAEMESKMSEPPAHTQEEILMLALSEAQIKQAEQQLIIDQLALAISEMQMGGTKE